MFTANTSLKQEVALTRRAILYTYKAAFDEFSAVLRKHGKIAERPIIFQLLENLVLLTFIATFADNCCSNQISTQITRIQTS